MSPRRLIILALLTAGCTTAAAGATSPAAPTPQIIYVTPAPIAVPTPSPTPTPDPTPTPTPVPVINDAFARYGEFLDHNSTSLGLISDLDYAIADDLALLDIDTAMADTQDLARQVNADLKWYKAHPPAACYAGAQKLTVQALNAQKKSSEAFIAWYFGWPYGADADYNTGMKWMNTATRLLDEATAELDAVDCGEVYLDSIS